MEGRKLRKIGRCGDKRALSNLVAYVLLISITISLSVIVYGWLKFYVESDNVATCPANVNVIIESYECFSGVDGNLTVKLKNKGLFDIDGFVLRVHDRPDADFGFYVFDAEGAEISPGGDYTVMYEFSDYVAESISDVTLVDVQPFLIEDDKVACEAYASQRIVCL